MNHGISFVALSMSFLPLTGCFSLLNRFFEEAEQTETEC